MITTDLILRIRTLLDEESASFWKDGEIYNALTDVQRDIVNMLYQFYSDTGKFPTGLRTLLVNTTGTGTATLPTNFKGIVDIYSGNYKIRQRPIDDSSGKDNSYTTSSTYDPYYTLTVTQIVFETSVAWTMDYIKVASSINGSTNPELDDSFADILAQGAYAYLLRKDDNPKADAEHNKFIQMMQGAR